MDPNQNPNCVFCRIIGGDEMVSVIHEDPEIIAFLDIQPLHPGHVLVMPKEHYKNLFYVPDELAARTFDVARRILPGLRKATALDDDSAPPPASVVGPIRCAIRRWCRAWAEASRRLARRAAQAASTTTGSLANCARLRAAASVPSRRESRRDPATLGRARAPSRR